MLCRATVYPAVRRAQCQRHIDLPAKHIAHFCHLVEYFVHADAHKVRKVHVHNGTRTSQSRAYAAAGDKCFRNGRIQHTVRELLCQPFELAENTALACNIFPHYEDFFVLCHFFGHRFQCGLSK